jgi:hypothetical protein
MSLRPLYTDSICHDRNANTPRMLSLSITLSTREACFTGDNVLRADNSPLTQQWITVMLSADGVIWAASAAPFGLEPSWAPICYVTCLTTQRYRDLLGSACRCVLGAVGSTGRNSPWGGGGSPVVTATCSEGGLDPRTACADCMVLRTVRVLVAVTAADTDT